MSYHAKYLDILSHIEKEIQDTKPGSRLPPIRTLMARYKVSQSVIERCLDNLSSQGVITRKQGSGIYVNGYTPRSQTLGVYTDSEVSLAATAMFLEGVREVADAKGYLVADFGPRDIFEDLGKVMDTADKMGLAGIITEISTLTFFRMESEDLLYRLQNLKLPIVTCLPLPGLMADSTMQDNFGSFKRLGEYYRRRTQGPILFLGYQGIPTLARLKGLIVGLKSDENLKITLLNKSEETVFNHASRLLSEGWKGNLVLGVPPDDTRDLELIAKASLNLGESQHLSLLSEKGMPLPEELNCHVIERRTKELGKSAAELLLKRIHGSGGKIIHRIIPHKISFAKEAAGHG